MISLPQENSITFTFVRLFAQTMEHDGHLLARTYIDLNTFNFAAEISEYVVVVERNAEPFVSPWKLNALGPTSYSCFRPYCIQFEYE